MMHRPTIIILLGAYWPGHESTGPNISVRAMCEALADRFDFKIVSRDRPFAGVTPLGVTGVWHDAGYAAIRYLKVGPWGAVGLPALLHATPHHLLILNGFFDREFSLPYLFLRRLGRVPAVRVLLSPRGELTHGALSIKSGRKALFRKLAEHLGLHRGVHFHATSELELADCRRAFPNSACSLAPNVRGVFPLPPREARAPDSPLRLAFVGRISRVKRLDFALRALAAAGVPADLNIYGPISDANYWKECLSIITELPSGTQARLVGEVPNAAVPAVLASHDALLLPSVSENFGHAIFESLASGTPVIIGDKTPWRDLRAHRAGFDLSVGDLPKFADAIRQLALLSDVELNSWREGARALVTSQSRGAESTRAMEALFSMLIAKNCDS